MFECKFCKEKKYDRERNLNYHQNFCHKNPNRKVKLNQFSKAKELGIEVPPSKTKGQPRPNWKPHSEETKKKLSEIAINRGFGGVTRSRWIKYKGKTLGSSYELKLAQSLDENHIKWDTCKRIKYVDPNGKLRTYTPDFYLVDYDIYLDPKNDYLINNINPSLGFSDIEKINLVENQNNIRILILSKEQLSWDIIKNLIS